jgi:hypothetical protein
MEPVKLLERAAGGAVNAVRHPVASASYAVGMLRGLAVAGMRAASGHRHDDAVHAPHVPTQRMAPEVEQDVPRPEPLVDSASVEAVRSESEMLRTDAERNRD